jgi:hypothetical protein
MNKPERSQIRIIRKGQSDETYDDGFIKGDPSYLLGIVWELTKDTYAFSGEDAERRLQRNITAFHR